MRNDVMLARAHIDAIAGVYNRGSTIVAAECDRGDVMWVRAGSDGTIYGISNRNVFTGHILHRF